MFTNIIKNNFFTSFNRCKDLELKSIIGCFCQGKASLDSSINHYSTNVLYDINIDKIIFSFLDEHIDTDLVIEKELDSCEFIDMLIGDFVWNQLQKNPDYLKDICKHDFNILNTSKKNYVYSMFNTYSFDSNDSNFSDYWDDYCDVKQDFLLKQDKYKNFVVWMEDQ